MAITCESSPSPSNNVGKILPTHNNQHCNGGWGNFHIFFNKMMMYRICLNYFCPGLYQNCFFLDLVTFSKLFETSELSFDTTIASTYLFEYLPPKFPLNGGLIKNSIWLIYAILVYLDKYTLGPSDMCLCSLWFVLFRQVSLCALLF